MKILLLDIGNTNTHLGLANAGRVIRQKNIPTKTWKQGKARALVAAFVGSKPLEGAALGSVVPQVSALAQKAVKQLTGLDCLELTAGTLTGIGIDYPKPKTIGADRLANAVAAHHHFGAPVIAVDFGTAVTFDVVDDKGNFVGGIIAPGLAAMTEYLHEKTAQLPRIQIRDPGSAIGKNTRQAMLVGAVNGYRGLVRELLADLKRELKAPHVPVVATGGYARLMASMMPEIVRVERDLTLEGLRLMWFGRKPR